MVAWCGAEDMRGQEGTHPHPTPKNILQPRLRIAACTGPRGVQASLQRGVCCAPRSAAAACIPLLTADCSPIPGLAGACACVPARGLQAVEQHAEMQAQLLAVREAYAEELRALYDQVARAEAHAGVRIGGRGGCAGACRCAKGARWRMPGS